MSHTPAFTTVKDGWNGITPPRSPFDRMLFESGLVRIGAFRCHAQHPSFHDTGPIRSCCFVFPRTAVEIQHEHEPAFVANPNVVTFYNLGQSYQRNAISPDGDHCDWFGVDPELACDVIRGIDPRTDSNPERPFLITRGWAASATYLGQRKLFNRVDADPGLEPLAVEESVIDLLDQVIASTRSSTGHPCAQVMSKGQRDTVRHIEALLSQHPEKRITLRSLAYQVGLSAYHVCRLFRRTTGKKLHEYRLQIRLRTALAKVLESRAPLTEVALDAGFSSHSHFTEAFRRQFGVVPSQVRAGGSSRIAIS